jgi:predicted SAM-dependent methyltransferase
MKLYLGIGDGEIDPYHYKWIDETWTKVDKFIERPDVLKMDARKLEFEPGTIEAIYASHIVEHIPYPDIPKMLENWFTVLQPGGWVHINVPDMEWIAEHLVKLCHGDYSGMTHYATPTDLINRVIYGTHHHEGEIHHSGYTEDVLRQCLQDAGFVDIKMEKEFAAHEIGCLLADAYKP